MNIIMRILKAIKSFFASPKKIKNSSKQQGTIKFFDRKKRFGFIIAGNHEYFFHASSAKSEDIKRLKDGARVNFILIQGKKGPQADRIEIA